MVSCLMGDSTALASAIVRCCHKKQFHREPIDETEPEVANFTDSGNAPSFDEIMKEIYSNVTYLVLPGREKKLAILSRRP